MIGTDRKMEDRKMKTQKQPKMNHSGLLRTQADETRLGVLQEWLD